MGRNLTHESGNRHTKISCAPRHHVLGCANESCENDLPDCAWLMHRISGSLFALACVCNQKAIRPRFHQVSSPPRPSTDSCGQKVAYENRVIGPLPPGSPFSTLLYWARNLIRKHRLNRITHFVTAALRFAPHAHRKEGGEGRPPQRRQLQRRRRL